MNEAIELRQKLDEVLDALCELPEDEIRAIFRGNRIPCGVDYIWEFWGTEYTVVSHFNKNAAECLMQTVDRLLGEDVRA